MSGRGRLGLGGCHTSSAVPLLSSFLSRVFPVHELISVQVSCPGTGQILSFLVLLGYFGHLLSLIPQCRLSRCLAVPDSRRSCSTSLSKSLHVPSLSPHSSQNLGCSFPWWLHGNGSGWQSPPPAMEHIPPVLCRDPTTSPGTLQISSVTSFPALTWSSSSVLSESWNDLG